MIEPGQTIELTYPDCTLINAVHELRHRRIQVHSIRDLVADPLTIAEYLRRPMMQRSRWLLKAYDLDTKQWRRFYLGTAKEFERPGILRVGLYRPADSSPYDLVSRPFGPTPRERQVLARVLAEWHQKDLGRLQLRVLADDLGVIRA